jgi:hypothetical protein
LAFFGALDLISSALTFAALFAASALRDEEFELRLKNYCFSRCLAMTIVDAWH